MTGAPPSRWRLRTGVRLAHDPVRDTGVLLHPDGVLLLNATATAVLALCDGTTGEADLAAALSRTYTGVRAQDVRCFLGRLAARQLIEPVPGRPGTGDG
ncbi:pyrroloquinoline quinone biosynthesis peptide chaperone PqqD [Streptomyces sp. NPDC049555]|uniref:pyrroloquinoline quinone biosynthesis peptide chaperone PqqD n=1 Tax=unclassified Streptomyces TaxID=2593676 RepID=UPI00342953B6